MFELGLDYFLFYFYFNVMFIHPRYMLINNVININKAQTNFLSKTAVAVIGKLFGVSIISAIRIEWLSVSVGVMCQSQDET